MEQKVLVFQSLYIAERDINNYIKNGWVVEHISMTSASYDNGCTRDSKLMIEKIIVLLRKGNTDA